MELQDWRKEPRKNYSNEFKLRMVELASQPGACVAQIARENGVNDNVIFKWLRLWQNEGRVSRRLPVTTSSDTGVELLPVEITPDEQKEPVAAIAPSLSTSTQTRVSASSCKVEFRHGNMTLENPSPELLTVLIMLANPDTQSLWRTANLNRPDFPGECFICELRLPDHCFRWKHNKLFLLLPEEYGPAFPAIVDCYTSPPT